MELAILKWPLDFALPAAASAVRLTSTYLVCYRPLKGAAAVRRRPAHLSDDYASAYAWGGKQQTVRTRDDCYVDTLLHTHT